MKRGPQVVGMEEGSRQEGAKTQGWGEVGEKMAEERKVGGGLGSVCEGCGERSGGGEGGGGESGRE